MTKYITIKLTEDQIDTLYYLVNEECYRVAQDENYPFMHRLRVKLARLVNPNYYKS